MNKPLIGLSCNFYHPDSHRSLFKNKRLVYHEQFLSRLIYANGGLTMPISHAETPVFIREVVERLDGLVLSGGGDVAPESYGAKPIDSEKWPGDRYLDAYQLEMIRAAYQAKKPILGICRGLQILNVFFGGTLYQDINQLKVGKLNHRCDSTYEHNTHKVTIEKDSKLFQIYQITHGTVNSVHHQCCHDMGEGLRVSAVSEDGIIEAIELKSKDQFVVGVQWHPEWTTDEPLLDANKLMNAFIEAVNKG